MDVRDKRCCARPGANTRVSSDTGAMVKRTCVTIVDKGHSRDVKELGLGNQKSPFARRRTSDVVHSGHQQRVLNLRSPAET